MKVREEIETQHSELRSWHLAPLLQGKQMRKQWKQWETILAVSKITVEYIMRNAGLEEAQAGIKISGRNINNLRYADDTTPMAESEEEPLDESERGEWKSWLKAQYSVN